VTRPEGAPGERHLDVHEDIRHGAEPFERILAAVDALGPEETLVLHVPFEPTPLYRALRTRGFRHRAERRAPGDWWVWFSRDPLAPVASSSTTPSPARGRAGQPAEELTVRLDVRGIEPPWPMVRILEALERLAPGGRLEVLHDRRPLFLYPQLDERGFRYTTDEDEGGRVRIAIWRDAGPA